MHQNFLQYLYGAQQGFNPYGAGNKVYPGGSPNAMGVDRQGYNERDLKLKARNNAILQRLKAQVQGRFMSPQYLNPYGGGSN